MKGISTIIATVLLVIIVVAIVGLTYTFSVTLFQQTTGGATNQTQQIVTSLGQQIRIESISAPNIYVRNIGYQTVNLTNVGVFLNDVKANFIPEINTLTPGNIAALTIIDFVNAGDKVRVVSGAGAVESTMNNPCGSAVLCLKFDEGSGNIVRDSSGSSGNDGIRSGTMIGDFENTLDGFGLNCGGIPTTSYVAGKNGLGLKLWSTGGDGLACATKSVGSFAPNYSIFFYSRGFVQAQFYDISGASYIQDVETSCRSVDGTANIFDGCNGGNPYADWKLFKVVAFRSSGGATLYIYNKGGGAVGESSAGYYDFITTGPAWIKGSYGNAMSFDGIDDVVLPAIAGSWNFKLTNFTIEYLFNSPVAISSQNATWPGIMGMGNNFTIEFDKGTGKSYFYPYLQTPIFTQTAFQPNRFYHVMTIFNGTKLKIFVNGKLENEASMTPLPLSVGHIGFGWNGAPLGTFQGVIDEIRIYNKAII